MNTYSKIADGLASWLDFEQRCGREPLFSESYLAYPLAQLLQYRFPGRVLSEVPHPTLAPLKTGPGKKPQVDFVVTGNDNRFDLVVETKWVSKSPTLLRDIIRDVIRLDMLVPVHSNTAILVLAGQKKEVAHLFENSQFKPHPANRNSKHILPLGNHTRASVRFAPVPRFRETLYSQVLSPFIGVDVSRSIQIERSGPFPRNANSTQYEVYIWKIIKHCPSEQFKPESAYSLDQRA